MSDTLEDIDTSQLDNVGRVKVDTPSTLNILDISTDCTRLVFDRLTLNQLIHLRAVCHAWNDIITDICEQKSTLQLFFSEDSIRHYLLQISAINVQNNSQFELSNQNLLLISQKLKGPTSQKALKRTRDGSICEQQNDPNLGIGFIARLFPNITNFVCSIKYSRMLEVNYILWKWAINLDTLTVYFEPFSYFEPISANAQQDFVKCFEMMSSLRRLHLLDINHQLQLPNMATFGQLEEFTFHSNMSVVTLPPYLAQLDANRCALLRVGRYQDVRVTRPNLTDVNPELASKLTHLAIKFFPNDDYASNHISRHIDKFQNLKHLEILNSCYGLMANLLKEFVSLKKLETLALELSSFVHLSQYHNNPNYPNSFPILHNTITELYLMDKNTNSLFPQFEEYQLLVKIFPMLRKIKIYCTSLKKTTFDEQFRPQFNEAFGEQVELIFYRTNLLMFDVLTIDKCFAQGSPIFVTSWPKSGN